MICRTLKTADATGYVETIPTPGVGKLTIAVETGTVWVKPALNASTAPSTPTNALVPASAGDHPDAVKVAANESVELDLSSGYAVDNQTQRITHLQIWSVSAGLVTLMGA